MGEALRRAGLPADDLDADGVSAFSFVDESGAVIGYGGLELCGGDALVRSIVVEPARRRRGAGRQIVGRLHAEAAGLGAARAFLLTTGARGYFESLGFAVIERNAAPPAILASRQAAALCPATATLMTKALAS